MGKVTLDEFKKIASSFFGILEKIDISHSNLERIIGTEIKVNELKGQDFISFSLRPSGIGSLAYTISYTRPGIGIPIEFKINPIFGYSHFIVKTQEEISGYTVFAKDPFGNLVQSKLLTFTDPKYILEEIERLSKIEEIDI